MIHTPECLVTACETRGSADKSMHEKYGSCYSCPECICDQVNTAYLRGIRDASVTVRYLVDKFEADTVQKQQPQ